MAALDPMRAFLKQHGAPPHVVEAGLSGLVALWESFAHDVWRGYDLGLDDYLNDLDARTLIAACLAHAAGPADGAGSAGAAGQAADAGAAGRADDAPPDLEALRERVASADARLRSATVARKQCLWGEAVAARRGWTAGVHWWYFRVPKQPGATLSADLAPG